MNSTVITIKGIVQGVGFRPFVWRLAKSLSLAGTVQNTSEGVQILLEGNEQAISKFLFQLSNNPPPLSKITSIKQNSAPVQNTQDFIILKSISTDELSSQVSPDISLCADCRKELYDPKDRRYHYPFINCTNCGPRYSIIEKLPYDRAATSMSEFNLCDSCAAEYSNPADRRYHAQPVACPDCGPHVFAVSPNGDKIEEPWENVWSDVVTSGKIAAVKGVGGFHLACNALDEIATALLRKRKRRESKPFAVMTRNIDWIKSVCHVSRDETALMKSRVCPIVILRIKKHLPSFKHIAPGLDTIGVMLPYSPLHELMCSDVNLIVVMTSANYSNEPMISRNSDALEKLHNLADIFLMHNRDIVNRCEDTVCICPEKQAIIIRPGRGHAPFSLNIDSNKQILSFGADLKNTFAVSHHGRITLSQYIGDLEHPKTQDILRSSVKKVLSFYNLRPESIIHDLHPDYFSTQIALDFAQKNNVPAVAVQHHHAHLAAGYAEHNLTGKAIGFAFDGTGYGTDGTIWGGEVMCFDSSDFSRELHLRPVALPGGDSAVKKPVRMLISYLSDAGLLDSTSLSKFISTEIDPVMQVIHSGINCPKTSSMGRLFDAVSCLLGISDHQTYDGEAAIKLEAVASKDTTESLPFSITDSEINCSETIKALLDQKARNIPTNILAGRFHNTIAGIIFECGRRLTQKYGELPWVFSGGVFQNRLLIKKILSHKMSEKHRLYFSSYPNDCGIALGQTAVADARYKNKMY